MPSKKNLLRAFLSLTFLESLGALVWLALLPTDVKNSILFGFTTSRLILLGGVMCMMALAGGMFFAAAGLALKIDKFLSRPNGAAVAALAALAIFLAGILFFCTPAHRMGEAFHQRLFPVAILTTLAALQFLVLQFFWMGKKLDLAFFAESRTALRASAVVLLIFVLLWVFMAWSGIGIVREPSGWLSPGTPILPQQMVFSGFVAALFFIMVDRSSKAKKNDLLLFLFIWLTTGLVWWFEPLARLGYFTPKPTPPNFEYYPYSDAANYDWFSQAVLIGTGRDVGLTYRPLYSFFLVLLHAIGGNGFRQVLLMQVFILALIPAIAYLLVSRWAGQPAGIMMALLLMLRERNSIALTNIIEVSHVKLIMSDMPTMLTMVLFIYLFVKWIRQPGDSFVRGLLAGAGLALSIFVRSQGQLLIPVVLVLLILIEQFRWKLILPKAAAFLLGIVVVLVPWVWRNYQVSGRLLVEYSDFYTRFIASSYSSSVQDYQMLPGETDDQYDTRMKKQIIQYIADHPAKVAHAYVSYFLHNEIASLTYLPMSVRFDTIHEYVKNAGFWDTPYLGAVPRRNLPALMFFICMIALGLGVSFQRFRWLGLAPLLFQMVYSFSSVLVHQSGWRFILPVDWIILLYFCTGLSEIGLLAYSMLFPRRRAQSPEIPVHPPVHPASWHGFGVALSALAILGVAIPLIEWGIPDRYPRLTHDVLIKNQVRSGLILENGGTVSAADVAGFLETDPAASVLYGRALYPSYYEQGKFWGELSPTLIEARKYNRLQFSLIGSQNAFVMIPLQQAPNYFPHASDVFVIGCVQTDTIRALVIKSE